MSVNSWPSWGVFLLFTIPVGGGIPAGVLLAKARHLPWPETSALYFVSDVCLAVVFEPLLKLMMLVGRRVAALGRIAAAFRGYIDRTTAMYGSATGPLALIGVAFGVDPMTGRAAAAAAGHGFFSGWALSITGDMLYFWVIMASTLSLGWLLGDGTVTTLIILALMMAVPVALKRWRERKVRCVTMGVRSTEVSHESGTAPRVQEAPDSRRSSPA